MTRYFRHALLLLLPLFSPLSADSKKAPSPTKLEIVSPAKPSEQASTKGALLVSSKVPPPEATPASTIKSAIATHRATTPAASKKPTPVTPTATTKKSTSVTPTATPTMTPTATPTAPDFKPTAANAQQSPLTSVQPVFGDINADQKPASPAEKTMNQQQKNSENNNSNNSSAQKSDTSDADSDDSDISELPTPSASPMKVPDNGYSKQFTGTLIAILVIIFLVFLVIWLVRRFSNNRPLHMNHRKHIKIIERRPLSQNTYIYLIQVGDEQVLMAESKFHVAKIATLDWNETNVDR